MKNDFFYKKALKLQKLLIKSIDNCNRMYCKNTLGKRIYVLPKVFPPCTDTILIAESIKIKKGSIVLDACSGTGILAIIAAKNAKKVFATDISKFAIENIKYNVKAQKLGGKVKAYKCSMFPNVRQKFDVIIINPPYTDHKAKGTVEKTVWDEKHQSVNRFFKQVRKHLKTDGVILLAWANFADYNYIEGLIKKHRFKCKIIARTKEGTSEYKVYKIKNY